MEEYEEEDRKPDDAGLAEKTRPALPSDLKPTGQSPYECFVQAQIIEAFKVMDDDEDGIIPPEDLGIIAQGLGCVPTLEQLGDLVALAEDEDSGYPSLNKLLPLLTDIIVSDRWKAVSEETLLQAFEVLEEECLGSLDPDYTKELFSKYGETLTEEEIESFLNAAVHPKMRLIYYKNYCNKLVPQNFDVLENSRKIRSELYRNRIDED